MGEMSGAPKVLSYTALTIVVGFGLFLTALFAAFTLSDLSTGGAAASAAAWLLPTLALVVLAHDSLGFRHVPPTAHPAH